MLRIIWYFVIGMIGIIALRFPSPPFFLLFILTVLIAIASGGLNAPPIDPHKKVRKQAKKITEITYKATINIPKTNSDLIDKLLYIDKLYQKKKISKAETSFYKHILPKLIALQEKQLAIAEIPGSEGQMAQSSFAPKMEQAYDAVEGWCDNRIKAYTNHLQLDSDIDKEVIVSLSKYL